MGCDGGTIPRRHELVKTKQRGEQKDKNADLVAKWKHCALSSEPLKEPIVACELGKLYNKDAVIEYLLNKKAEKKAEMKHIKGLKDIHTLSLHRNPAWKSRTEKAEKGDGYIDDHDSKYICPISGVEMNGKHKFCYLRSCACVLSQRALKELRGSVCGICSKEYSESDDVVMLNGDKEEMDLLQKKIDQRRKEKKSQKSQKKLEGEKIENPKKSVISRSSGTMSTDTFSKKIPGQGTAQKLEVSGTLNGVKRKMEEDTIYKTESFKSIFTSHNSAKRSKNQKAHWITYNPYHC